MKEEKQCIYFISIIKSPRNFNFDFNEDFDKNLKYEIEFIIKRN